ncbi:transcriptional regulator, XRE family with cupin sensor [Actinopolyspora lacussalsi subsp. righensis]|uniref:Transcriptional regulator, XRE family with cupin sensor n=1 Tax=Actinopolyspora righensis TaxID=995060 RepID=A0A1I7CBC7_9ACTN|nr:XRE family transcriptional regulator [Actinopolyspora righensis]SFT96726.1 transcriptional regulator, XRE family with cupin sensor [Actinopolyspora righensis]
MRGSETEAIETISIALRHHRERAGISLSELAKRAGVAKSTLSQLESGEGNPGVETLWALAVALNVPFSRLVELPTPHTRVIRAGQAPKIRAEHAGFAAGLLSACPAGASRDIYEIGLEAGEIRRAEPHQPGTVEHLIVVSGSMRGGPADGPVELEPGDYTTFSGAVPHLYQAVDGPTTAVLLMEHS